MVDRSWKGAIKWLSVVDEYTQQCRALEVRRSFKSRDVIQVLRELILIRREPVHIRSDNGPEFIAGSIRSWMSESKISVLYIKLGSPWENGYAESFHSQLRG